MARPPVRRAAPVGHLFIDAERQSLEDVADPVTSTKRRGAVRAEGADPVAR